jgi:hypothetical protein
MHKYNGHLLLPTEQMKISLQIQVNMGLNEKLNMDVF